MNGSEKLKQLIEQYKNEAESFLAENKVDEAEAKTLEVKILKAKLEVQEELDTVNGQLENLNAKVLENDETIKNLTTDLETANNEKTELMNKFTDATETVTNLTAQVKEMQPIVDKYNEELYNNKVSTAKETYKAKFEKCDAADIFASEEIQNLVLNTINDDEKVSTKAKYDLSERLLNAIESKDSSTTSVKDINEPAKETKNLNVVDDEFESTYGFKKE